MSLEILCRKIGMTRVFDEEGQALPVTVLEAGPNVVVQKKTEATDGYSALQLGFADCKPRNVTRPRAGHFRKAGSEPRRHLSECRVTPEDAESYQVGQEIRCDVFQKGQRVDVIGTSKGRGTAGVVKRHNFSVHGATHGTHEYFRHGGSIGASAFPSRVIKGMRMPGRHGNSRVTVRNVEVVGVDRERNLLLLRGAVPGHPNGLVRVRPAVAVRG